MTAPTHSYRAFVACDVASAWDALINGDKTVAYYYGTRVESDWQAASRIRYLSPDDSVVADGFIVTIDPPHLLEMMFHARWDPELDAEGPVRMVWRVDDSSGLTAITVDSHLDTDTKSYTDWERGIPFIVSGLKTLLETGRPMTGAG
ncbi:MAG: SRPBCC domain-containing protein [Acidimicrobiia bacterium]|nr:SRPBCC domain-containing protein [Acidimicrobiia bacterium]